MQRGDIASSGTLGFFLFSDGAGGLFANEFSGDSVIQIDVVPQCVNLLYSNEVCDLFHESKGSENLSTHIWCS